jgi:hypothetical protein
MSTYDDKGAGGTSEINAAVQKDASGNYIHMAGKVVMTGYLGFASFSTALNNGEAVNTDISEYKSISFDVKGNGEGYYVLLISSQVKDYNFHAASFETTKEWKTVTLPFSGFGQNPYYGKQLSLDLKTIQFITFTAMNKNQTIDFDVKNIRLVK